MRNRRASGSTTARSTRSVESLEKNGLIVARETVREGKRPERTIYEITDQGAREMVDWMTDLIGTPEKEYPKFMAGLSFLPALTPDDALQALRARAEILTFKLAKMRGAIRLANEAGLPRLFELEAEYEEQATEAELHFVNGLVKDIESGDLDGLEMWNTFHDPDRDPEEVVFRLDPP